jgi:ribosomal protein S8
LIRRSIDKHPERLKKVLTAEGFAAEFFGKLPKKTDEKTLVKLFAEKNGEDALKTAPKVWQTHTLHHTDPAPLYHSFPGAGIECLA